VLISDSQTKTFPAAQATLYPSPGGGMNITLDSVPIGTSGLPTPPGSQINNNVQTHDSVSPPSIGLSFGGFANASTIKVYHETSGNPPALTNQAQLIDGAAGIVGVTGATNVLCDDCEFLQWGVWLAATEFTNQGTPNTNVSAAGYWVAGDIVRDSTGELPLTGKAFYSGKALGNVATNLFTEDHSWATYAAIGKMWMKWNFADRTGYFKVRHFDEAHFHGVGGLRFSGKINMAQSPTNGLNQFNGSLWGPYGLKGKTVGSFVKAPGQVAGNVPKGVIGNWGVGNYHYKAGGIFAGSQVTPH
jgi:hypothetical protein